MSALYHAAQVDIQERAYGSVDGSYLRRGAKDIFGHEYMSPHAIANNALLDADFDRSQAILKRVSYYDAEEDQGSERSDESDARLKSYFEYVCRQRDTELRFGFLRAKAKKQPRAQEGVDVLLAVDMVVGVFNRIFDIAVLVAGDADFVPAVQETCRRGTTVIVAVFTNSISADLRNEADRIVYLDGLNCDKFKGFKANV